MDICFTDFVVKSQYLPPYAVTAALAVTLLSVLKRW